MPPRVAPLRSTLSSSFSGISTGLHPRASIYRLQPVLVRTNATVGTSAEGVAFNIQQVPAPGSGYIRVLLLNRPEARNAISRNLLNTLRFHVDAIAAEQGNGPTR